MEKHNIDLDYTGCFKIGISTCYVMICFVSSSISYTHMFNRMVYVGLFPFEYYSKGETSYPLIVGRFRKLPRATGHTIVPFERMNKLD